MATITIEDISPELIERLEVLADRHGRSLQEELRQILEVAAPTPPPARIEWNATPEQIEKIVKMAEGMREQLAHNAGIDVATLKPLDRDSIATGLERLKALKKISLEGMSIREMREEGRRF
ncbi:MAG: hypothetical protein F6J93_01590 [Oscillatoria sp. SIO1A7]|nr:hypothetical protein [Oscillatoria sp. SIO1A7]